MMRQISEMVAFRRDAYPSTFPNVVLCHLKCFFKIANGIFQTFAIKAPRTGILLNKMIDLLMRKCNIAVRNDGLPNKQCIYRTCHDPAEYCKCVVKFIGPVCISFQFRAYPVQSIVKSVNVCGLLRTCCFCDQFSSNNLLFLCLIFSTALFLNCVCAVKDPAELLRFYPLIAFIGAGSQSWMCFILHQHQFQQLVRL